MCRPVCHKPNETDRKRSAPPKTRSTAPALAKHTFTVFVAALVMMPMVSIHGVHPPSPRCAFPPPEGQEGHRSVLNDSSTCPRTTLLSTASQAHTASQVGCPGTWTTYDGMCYKVISSTSTWYAANALCRGEANGASLAVVSSAGVHSTLAGMISGSTWIGMTDIRRGK